MKYMLVPFFILALLNEIVAQKIVLFDAHREWILSTNKIETDTIFLTPFDSTKVGLNTLVLSFAPKHKIVYDYKSNVAACAGVDFLDMDSDQTFWTYNAQLHRVTLIVKGGYSSIDDFKFKREYEIESMENGDYELRKVKEYYFTDLANPTPVSKAKKKRKS